MRRTTLGWVFSFLSLALVGDVTAAESPAARLGQSVSVPDAAQVDAAEIASMHGISVAEARSRIDRQPRIGELAAALDQRGPTSYGGIFIDQSPDYQVIVLVEEGSGSAVEGAIDDLGFSDLKPFIAIRETPFTLDVLKSEMERVAQLSAGLATSLDLDIRTGEILVIVATLADVSAVRTALASAQPPIGARNVIVEKGRVVQEHAFGGLPLSTCTSGFSVRRTTDNAKGVSTAAHCPDAQTLQKHGTALDHIAGQNYGSLDVQWHKTPGLTDPNLIRYNFGGDTRSISFRTARHEMVVGGNVCNFGKTTGYKCGTIVSKDFDYDGWNTQFNPTFIRVDGPQRTDQGDSGGPWFLGNSAYGIHKDSLDPSGDMIFTAQNYMSSLDLVVKINP
jgi:streptogrisin C